MSNAPRVMPTHIVAVAGVVMNDEGKLLLVRNRYRGTWEYPGGQVENGENLVEALQREIREESGVEVEVGEMFCIASNVAQYPGYNGVKEVPTKVMLDFACKRVGGQERTSDETSEVAWFTPQEAQTMIAAPALKARFEAYLARDGRPSYLSYVTKPEFELRLERKI